MERLSADEARRAAVAAQGFGHPRPRAPVAADLERVIQRIGLVQIDSVNVLERSHYLPLFSRLGPYRRTDLDSLAYRGRRIFEQWGHMASFVQAAHYGLMRHRMEARKPSQEVLRIEKERPGYIAAVLDEVRQRGPLTVSDLEDGGERTGPWWGYSAGKVALEWHFLKGNLAVAERRNFARVYDLPERVFPHEVLQQPPLEEAEAHREMLRIAAQAHGVGTARDLADYFRINVLKARPRLEELADTGEIQRVEVEGWREPGYAARQVEIPHRIEARALLSPFDSVVWERDRIERIFGFRYRIEIYTPEPQRRYGYYVLPFLLGDRLAGRVDLKADRQRSVLMVRGSYAEPGERKSEVASAMSEEFDSMAAWLELERVSVGARGNLARDLRAVRRGRTRPYSRDVTNEA
jgi:hypothetical protein